LVITFSKKEQEMKCVELKKNSCRRRFEENNFEGRKRDFKINLDSRPDGTF